MIPYGHQSINDSDIKEVVKALKSDYLTQGPKILEFEKALANYCGAKYAVVCSNGTAALYLAYLAAGISKGDEVITTPNTFVATSNMLIAVGARPVFCDIRLDTYNLDEEKIESLITKKTKAIVPVHFAGYPCEMDQIRKIAKKHNLLVIEDACHALGAIYKNKRIGSISDMTVFSFHPVKSITTGEGGAILTNSKDYYERLLSLRSHGSVKDPRKMSRNEGPWYYEFQELSGNYRITDLQCALGISQLGRLDKFIAARTKIAAYYFKKLNDFSPVILPAGGRNSRSGWHLFVIRVKKSRRKKIFDKLRQAGIGVQVHYIPVYCQPFYRNNGFKSLKLANTEKYYAECISLPIFPGLRIKDQNYVIRTLKKLAYEPKEL